MTDGIRERLWLLAECVRRGIPYDHALSVCAYDPSTDAWTFEGHSVRVDCQGVESLERLRELGMSETVALRTATYRIEAA